MATPTQLRDEIDQIAEQAVVELRGLVASLSPTAMRSALLDLLPGLLGSYSEAAGVVAAEWYDDHRAELAISGNYTALIPDMRDPGVQALLGWAESQAKTTLSELSLIEQGSFRRVANGGRSTIIANVGNDPQAKGYQRFARSAASGCAFCRMLAGRGAVYRSADSASFAAHDNCHCVAVPAFTGEPVPVKPYTPSDRNISDADRARVREYLRNL